MPTDIIKHLRERPAPAARSVDVIHAFTLIELLVVFATLAVLSVIFLPALAGSRAQPQVTACAANFRQWAVSVNLYANDNLDRLPRFDWNGAGGSYVWAVSTNFISNLAPYGLTVPMWFCPVRPSEFDATEKTSELAYGRVISSPDDLENVLDHYAHGSSSPNNYREALIYHNWWVPRSAVIPPTTSSLYPPDPTLLSPALQAIFFAQHPEIKGTPVGTYGLPRKLRDNAAAHVPFISDLAGSGSGSGLATPLSGRVSSNPGDCSPNTAHFVNGILLGVNAAYADGHVEAHSKTQMNCGYGQLNPYWFF